MRRLLVSLVALCLAGCAGILADPIWLKSSPKPGLAYAYGTFTIEGDYGPGNIALRLKPADAPKQEDYYIALSPSGRRGRPLVWAYEVRPGAYEFGEISYMTSDHDKPRRNAYLPFHTKVQIEPNKAYYLGDYVGELRRETSAGVVKYHWNLTNVADNFARVTLDVEDGFPNFRNMDKVNLLRVAGKNAKATNRP